ncbi:GTP-binding protein [Clostridium sp. D43t1_170807_H7]|uniref:sulfate adenylyltransferase subunit 1 n=1 Tax=Clostridium sp. D43t1_170807_H7 TaxID=2787140 RepID=UPI001897BAE1|nr:GTP-binding protein [Clostridium sp. D43t1_170807_H7]MEE0933422.1 GTP-binding protein [Clostridium sp.]
MKGLLKFITCGSVDDGKSTLIGHILYDAKLLYADQEKALELDSKVGSREGAIDYSLLLDGLMAEREQGITIDVAYRYFTTDNRSFIVADTPGHEEYTRNMAVGASFADLAIILVDAKQGVLVQTRRHARICSLMGIKYFIFAINKMDLIQYDKNKFEKIEVAIKELQQELKLKNIKIIPISATEGDNVTTKSFNTPWYDGPDILTYLENVEISDTISNNEFYIPIQRVCRPNHEFRGFQGQIEEGEISVGDEVIILPSNEKAIVKSIYVTDNKVDIAQKGQPVTIQLNKEVDVSRGCVLTKNKKITTSRFINSTILWMDDNNLKLGEEYFIKVGTKMIPAIITDIKYKIDVNSGEHLKTTILKKNEIALCDIFLSEKIVVDKFSSNKTLGELILIDRVTNMTSACGVIENIDYNDSKKDVTFRFENLNARGDIFEEYYYNTESLSIYKNKKNKKVYTIGDVIDIKGETFEYPKDFDILILRDWIAIEIRDKVITNIKSMDKYNFNNLPVVNGRGFKLNICDENSLKSLLVEYKEINMNNTNEFWNKWANINTYRNVIFN